MVIPNSTLDFIYQRAEDHLTIMGKYIDIMTENSQITSTAPPPKIYCENCIYLLINKDIIETAMSIEAKKAKYLCKNSTIGSSPIKRSINYASAWDKNINNDCPDYYPKGGLIKRFFRRIRLAK